jgi:hypothetical protein
MSLVLRDMVHILIRLFLSIDLSWMAISFTKVLEIENIFANIDSN